MSFIANNYGGKKGLVKYYLYKAAYYVNYFNLDDPPRIDNVERFVFVCRGNICRSPYAEYYANKIGLNSVSAGFDARPNNPAYDVAIHVANERGVDLSSHKAKMISAINLQETDLILVMEPWHLKVLINMGIPKYQISLLGIMGKVKRPYLQDPYGRSHQYFAKCFNNIEEPIQNLVERM
jgi:protein-tyrosine phosphatase